MHEGLIKEAIEGIRACKKVLWKKNFYETNYEGDTGCSRFKETKDGSLHKSDRRVTVNKLSRS